jgi:hypothetical protein
MEMTMSLGLGVMIARLGVGSSRSASEYLGHKIVEAQLDSEYDRFILKFENGKRIAIVDDGQCCCEHRYVSTDDDVSALIGGTLVRIEARDGPSVDGNTDDCHETCFVEVATDQAHVTLVNHNEHNGYYGGFALSIKEI